MKKTVFTFLLLIVAIINKGQISNFYTFSNVQTIYVPINGGTSVGNNISAYLGFNNINIGFTFNYYGVNYTKIGITTNGYVVMGNSLNTSAISNIPISDLSANDSIISVCGSFLDTASNSSLTYITLGTAPNRTFTVQWKNRVAQFNSIVNFQLKLHETSNVIEFVYGNFIPSTSQSDIFQVGLRGNGINDFKNRNAAIYTPNNIPITWASSIAGTYESDICEIEYYVASQTAVGPPFGLKYVWTPISPCNGTPNPGFATSTFTTACPGQSLSLALNAATNATGLTYQWQSSPNNASWSLVNGATSPTFVTTFTTTIYYRCVLACGTNTAASVSVNVVPQATTVAYASVPFLENFDNTWQNKCDLRNVPTSLYWKSFPTNGYNSWRRQDDGVSINLLNNNPLSTLAGNGCAVFFSPYAGAGSSGEMDLNVNMGTSSSYQLSFYYVNGYGDDSLKVFLSTNGGATFTKKATYKSGDYNAVDQNWNKKVINLGVVNSPSCVVKFKAYNDSNNSDELSIDSLRVRTTGACIIPTLALTASQGTICSSDSLNLNATGALSYTWNPGNINAAALTTAPALNTTYTVTGKNGPSCTSIQTIAVIVNISPTVNISPLSSTICVGSIVTLTASGATNYSWNTTSANSIISVTPVGNTIYTLTGSNALCSQVKTATVIVKSSPLLSVSGSSSIICSGITTSVTATAFGAGVLTYSWNTAATTSVIAITPTTNTNYTVTVKDLSNNCQTSSSYLQSVIICTVTALQDFNSKVSRLKIYPNPTTDRFTVESNLNDRKKFELIDVSGSLKISFNYEDAEKIEVDISNLPNGVYFIKVWGNNYFEVKKIIKD